jgi:hypothetical protein
MSRGYESACSSLSSDASSKAPKQRSKVSASKRTTEGTQIKPEAHADIAAQSVEAGVCVCVFV